MLHIVHAGYSVGELKGEGVEFLLDKNDNIIAKFVDGNFESIQPKMGNTEVTEILMAA